MRPALVFPCRHVWHEACCSGPLALGAAGGGGEGKAGGGRGAAGRGGGGGGDRGGGDKRGGATWQPQCLLCSDAVVDTLEMPFV